MLYTQILHYILDRFAVSCPTPKSTGGTLCILCTKLHCCSQMIWSILNLLPSMFIHSRRDILGKRMAFGANGIAQASQLVSNLIIGDKNATDGVEAPRFYLLDNSTIAVEGDKCLNIKILIHYH